MRERYDPVRQIYRDCRWCGGNGCISCPIEAQKAYKEQFPDGPQPIATFTKETVGQLRDVLSPEAIASAATEARRRAELKVATLGGFRKLLDCSDEEAIESLIHEFLNEVLVERIVQTQGTP